MEGFGDALAFNLLGKQHGIQDSLLLHPELLPFFFLPEEAEGDVACNEQATRHLLPGVAQRDQFCFPEAFP